MTGPATQDSRCLTGLWKWGLTPPLRKKRLGQAPLRPVAPPARPTPRLAPVSSASRLAELRLPLPPTGPHRLVDSAIQCVAIMDLLCFRGSSILGRSDIACPSSTTCLPTTAASAINPFLCRSCQILWCACVAPLWLSLLAFIHLAAHMRVTVAVIIRCCAIAGSQRCSTGTQGISSPPLGEACLCVHAAAVC